MEEEEEVEVVSTCTPCRAQARRLLRVGRRGWRFVSSPGLDFSPGRAAQRRGLVLATSPGPVSPPRGGPLGPCGQANGWAYARIFVGECGGLGDVDVDGALLGGLLLTHWGSSAIWTFLIPPLPWRAYRGSRVHGAPSSPPRIPRPRAGCHPGVRQEGPHRRVNQPVSGHVHAYDLGAGSTKTFALLAVHHADIADDSPRLRYALECWTGLNRAATRRWLRGEATREMTHEVIASTLEHVLRTFGTPPAPSRSAV